MLDTWKVLKLISNGSPILKASHAPEKVEISGTVTVSGPHIKRGAHFPERTQLNAELSPVQATILKA